MSPAPVLAGPPVVPVWTIGVGIVAAGVDDDVEQALIDAQLHRLAGDIGGRAVDPDRAAMDDPRRDHGDDSCPRLERVDLRARPR